MSIYAHNTTFTVHTEYGSFDVGNGTGLSFSNGNGSNINISFLSDEVIELGFDNCPYTTVRGLLEMVNEPSGVCREALTTIPPIPKVPKNSDSRVSITIMLHKRTDYAVHDFYVITTYIMDELYDCDWSFSNPFSCVIKPMNKMALKEDKVVKGENLRGVAFDVVNTFTGKDGDNFVIANYGKDIGGSCLDGKLDKRSCLILAMNDVEELTPKEEQKTKQKGGDK